MAKEVLSPMSVTARTLFQQSDEDAQSSTQGNSDGEVNSPKVGSEGSYVCGVCKKMFKNSNEVDEHMKLHDKATNAAIGDISFENDEEVEKELTEAVKAHEAMEEEIVNINNWMTVDKIIDTFVDMAFKEMSPNSVTPEPQCEECTLKYEVFENPEKLLEKKDREIIEKTATIAGMSQKVKTGRKQICRKKLKETDSLKKTLTEKNK